MRLKGNNISCEFGMEDQHFHRIQNWLIHNVQYMPNYVSGNKTAVFRLVATINCLSTETIEIRVETGMCSF